MLSDKLFFISRLSSSLLLYHYLYVIAKTQPSFHRVNSKAHGYGQANERGFTGLFLPCVRELWNVVLSLHSSSEPSELLQ